MNIEQNLTNLRTRIANACARANRSPNDVTLVAVTKTVTPTEIAELYRLGIRHFGENRVADGIDHKNALNAPDALWHLIGHLQRNKADSALTNGFTFIHSVESPKLVDVLDTECEKNNLKANILLEVNVSGEDSKYGIPPTALTTLAEKVMKTKNLTLQGLMTMAPFTDNPETARPHFKKLAQLRSTLQQHLNTNLPHLSMGMTNDFEPAIEEGATLIRIGTALFR